MTDPSQSSYVDSYAPPIVQPPATTAVTNQNDPGVAPAVISPIDLQNPPAASGLPPVELKLDFPSTNQTSDTTQTPSTSEVAQETDSTSTGESISQELADQNIFEMLGANGAPEAEKEQFMTQLQEAIWQDFVDHDVELLLTEAELADFQKLKTGPEQSSSELQDRMIEYLDKLVPDLDKIMLEKALEFKEEIFRERVKSMLTSATNDPEKSAKLHAIENLLAENKWHDAVTALNQV